MQPWYAHGGDPTRTAWIVVLGYVIGIVLTVLAARRAPATRERRFWWLATGALVLLGLNKQLDLQTLMTETLRQMSRHEGWYRDRREAQLVFIIGLVAAGAVGGALMLAWLARARTSGGVMLATAGLALLGVFVLVRATSFHHVDTLLRGELLGLRLYVWLEVAGIAVVGLGAAIYGRGRGGRRTGRQPGYR
jgi:hypothetical protein